MKNTFKLSETAARAVAAALFIILYPLAGELLVGAGLKLGVTVPKLLFALCIGVFLYFLGNLHEKQKWSFLLQAVGCCLVSILQLSQFVYWKIFNTPYYLKSTAGLGAALEFWHVALDAAMRYWPCVIGLIALPVLLFTVYRRWYHAQHVRAPRRPIALACILLMAFGLCTGLSQSGGADSPRSLLLGACVPVASARAFGILPTMALDFKSNILGIEIPDAVETSVSLSDLTVEQAQEETLPVIPPKAPKDYPENAMDIQFDLEEPNAVFQDMNAYFGSREPTHQNEYTGMFKGKNLILITAEGFSKFVIDKERTPTLYKLYEEGFQFDHFYTPIWGVSTSDGEFVATTGLVPQNGVWSYTQIAGHTMPFALGNQFAAKGATTLAFHNHSYTYYNRHLSYPTMGYTYYGMGNGLSIVEQWPESDVELMEQSTAYYENEDSFHIYYMTVSGHLAYTFDGNRMATKHKATVENLPYCEAVQAYIGCQLELEDALTQLLEKLEATGQLDNTVIALSADHYPYGLTNEEYAELRGKESLETAFELYENAFLLWTPDMEESVQVDTYCSSLDILPTLSNLFGLTYDSRLMMGTDIFSGTPPMILFYDHSFINDKVMYDASSRRVVQRTGQAVTQEQLNATITDAENRFAYSKKIIETDYYGYLLGK